MSRPSTRTVGSCRIDGAGHEWDAVRVPRSVGYDTVRILGVRAGAVLEDPQEACVYFFIETGAALTWNVPGTRVLARGSHVVIPPARRAQGPGPHWRVCPGDDQWITDAAALRAALEDAAGPRPVVAQ